MNRFVTACGVLALLLLLLLLRAAGSASAAGGAPVWLVRVAQRAAAGLSDGTTPATIRYVAPRSRFPRVVLTGHFVCHSCSAPAGAAFPTGTVAEMRYDGKTHGSLDFALCKSRVQCDRGLCSFGACTRTGDKLDAAFSAFDARMRGIAGDPDPFSRRPGTFRCHIHYPVREMRYVVGSCTTAVRELGLHASEVRLIERWRPRVYRRHQWVRLATRTHVWRIQERKDGWQVTIRSSGDPAPQLPKDVQR